MNQRTFTLSASVVFLVISIVHLVRVIEGWEAMVAGWSVPLWFSYVAACILGYLALCGLKLSGKLR